MHWAFLLLAIATALMELHTGTFYLAAVAAAAGLTTLIGFWVPDSWLIVVFLLLCALATGGVMLMRRGWRHGRRLADFDIGQPVSITGTSPDGVHLMVAYRGANWTAEMNDGSLPIPGATAIITGKTDKLLHLRSAAGGNNH